MSFYCCKNDWKDVCVAGTCRETVCGVGAGNVLPNTVSMTTKCTINIECLLNKQILLEKKVKSQLMYE